MTLSDVEAQALLTTPKHLTQKAEALRWQNRVRFHGLTVKDKHASAHWPTFKEWVFGYLLVQDKRDLFDAFFPFPTPCVPILAKAQDAFMKVFDAVNPRLDITAEEGIEDDLLDYLKTSGEVDFWPDEAISAIIESHEDILLIDLKPSTGRPEPYLVRVQLDSVVSVEYKSDATCESIAYITADGNYIVVDDDSYRLFIKSDAGFTLKATYPHYLGRCPARKLWDERVPNHPIASASIVDEILSRLDEYAYWYVGYGGFKLFGANPIYYGAAQENDLADEPLYIPTNEDGTPDAGYPDACHTKSKSGSSFVGPGDFFEIPPGGDLSVPPVGIVEPSTDSLNFQSLDISQQEDYLMAWLTGLDGESPMAKEAINEKQVGAGFVDKQTKLLYLSRHLSAARQWTILTFGQLRHGGKVKAVDHSFGTEFYLQTEDELWDGLNKAKVAGSPRTILYEKIRGIEAFRLRTGGNPTRSQILLDLEPLIESTIIELLALLPLGLVKPETIAVKSQFTDLIGLMERSLGADVTQLGVKLPYQTRIETLTKFLYDNVSYTKPEPIQPGRPGATA